MEAAIAQQDGVAGVSVPALRTLVGTEVAVDTATEHLEGTLLSCTRRSLWIVSGDDVDHVVAVPGLVSVHAR
jgi:hypothetical protein